MNRNPNTLAVGEAPGWLGFIFIVFLIQLPFELPDSLIPLPGLVVTHLEITLALLVSGYLVWKVGGRTVPGRPAVSLRQPQTWIVVWLAALFLSSVLAPGLRVVAVKFSLRAAAIALLFWISRDVMRSERLQKLAMVIIAVLAGVVALLGVLEGAADWVVEPILQPFRPRTTFMGGVWRLTSVFSHANQAAAWMAMSMPIAIGVGLRSSRGFILWSALLGLIGWGLAGTLSRTGIVSGYAVALVMLLLWTVRPGVRRRAAFLLLLLAGLATVRLATSPALRDRFGVGKPGPSFSASYDCPARMSLGVGESTSVTVTLTNDGYVPWSSRGLYPVHLSYRLHDLDRLSDPPAEGLRGNLPATLRKGDSGAVRVPLVAPDRPGLYLVAWDVVREGVFWFTWDDVIPGLTLLQVSPRSPSDDTAHDERFDEWYDGMAPAERLAWLGGLAAGETSSRGDRARSDVNLRGQGPMGFESGLVTRSALWKVAMQIFRERPLTGSGPDTFRYLYSRRLGLEDGDVNIHANNMYLELLATGGALACAAWLLFLGTLGYHLMRSWRRMKPWPFLLGLSAWGGVVAVFCAHALLDSFMGSYEVMGFFWIASGAVASSLGQPGTAQ